MLFGVSGLLLLLLYVVHTPHLPPLPPYPQFPCFDDDMMGTAAGVLAGVLAALPKTGGKLDDHTFVLSGENAHG